jgi:hypothetical protein
VVPHPDESSPRTATKISQLANKLNPGKLNMRVKQIMKKYDTNQDGVYSPEEVAVIVEVLA